MSNEDNCMGIERNKICSGCVDWNTNQVTSLVFAIQLFDIHV